MKRTLYFILNILLFSTVAKGQHDCIFTHYSSENGLSQNTIMSILQDHKGNMWFSTWDGINKFDGYSFRKYKARLDNKITLSHNRIDYMGEDKYGFIWLLTYDNHVYRFNPKTEFFERVPAGNQEGSTIAVTKIIILNNGVVWLLTDSEGAIRVITDPGDYNLTSEWYSSQKKSFPIVRAFNVYQDLMGNEWVLTNNGLGKIHIGEYSPAFYFAENDELHKKTAGQSFYSCLESGAQLYFGSDGGRVWCYQKNTGRFNLLKMPTDFRIVAIGGLGTKGMIFVTDKDGFFVYTLKTKLIEHYPASLFPASSIISAYVDKSFEVWFEQHVPGKVVHFNPRTKILKREELAVEATTTDRSHPAFHIHEDIYGTVWVHPYGGGFSYFDRKSNSLKSFYNSLSGDNWHFSNKIHSAFSDRQGNLWMCTHSKGLEKITFRRPQFRMITPEPHSYESLSNEVRALCEDRERNLWVGLKDGKLKVYKQGRYCGYLTEAGAVSNSGLPIRGTVYFVMQDRKRNIWIATKGEGLIKAEPERQSLHYKIKRYKYDTNDIYSLSNDNVYCAYEDERGRLWVATYGGGINYLTRDQKGKEIFINHRNNLKNYPIDNCYKARFVTSDRSGHIWIGTTVGALMFDESFKNPEDIIFHHYSRVPDRPHSISNNDVHWITITKAKELYAATFGGGLNKLISLDKKGNAEFKSYTVDEGLSSDIVLSMQEDRHGNLWLSTENGVSKFIPSTERFENYDDKTISFPVRFSEAASVYLSTGGMLFGSNTGIFSFVPDSIKKSGYTPPIVLSKLLIANQDVVPGEKSILKQTIDDIKELRLSHKENIFSISFAALDYSAPSEIQYAYILEGFEKNWNYVGNQRLATYTNLPKGHYVFKVRSTNSDGVWTSNIRSLDIEILPSFWETPLAYLLYVLFIIAIIVVAAYILFTIYRLKHRVSMEQQMTDMKLRFFTDISHELRTPLTLIAGPVECVLQNPQIPATAREQLQIVERNTSRMLRLVNQILDFRKIQNKKMKMQVQRVNIVSFIQRIMENFDSAAEEHQIDFLFETESKELYMWVDSDKFEKIIFNLLSNAFKYTPNGKMITVFIREDEATVSIGVQDQGIGIAENKKKSLFVRFENLVDRNLFHQASTGIGLSLVKELVEMHKGNITVDSRLGEGSCFMVSFLKGKEHYERGVEFLQDDSTVELELKPVSDSYEIAEVMPDQGPYNEEIISKELMLIVEDNAELRLFLRSIFSSEYRIVEAIDGLQGWNKALKYLPDIIISDVMMPEKDGISMTRELRADMNTSHIPIVLLTAKTSEESKLEGIEYGADDYITKPFSAVYLKVRVKNLLQQRRKLQQKYHANPEGDLELNQTESLSMEEHVPGISRRDKEFMDKLADLMEKNMDNGDLVVDDLVQELAVSRSVFFKKLKSLTGLAPVEFIKEMRIKHAIKLIESGEFTMTQISYMVGINDPRYFSKCFKQKMGMTPTEFRDHIFNKNIQ